jgi:hypothetical protein
LLKLQHITIVPLLKTDTSLCVFTFQSFTLFLKIKIEN